MRPTRLGLPFLAVLLAILTSNLANAQPAAAPTEHVGLATPGAIRTAHQHLREALARALADPGAVGGAAKSIERTLTPHLKHDEDAILPPLGMLRPLVDGQDVADSKPVTELVRQIERELPQLLLEHRAILDGVKRLRDASERERKPEYLTLADELWTHAVVDDQVLYPASILVGRYLTLKETSKSRTTRAPVR